MTAEDEVYADWLDVLGSDIDEPEAVAKALHRLHEAAEASHGTVDGIRPHLPMTAEQADLRRRMCEALPTDLDPAAVEELREGTDRG